MRKISLQVDEESTGERVVRRIQDRPNLAIVLDKSMTPVSSTTHLVLRREVTESPI